MPPTATSGRLPKPPQGFSVKERAAELLWQLSQRGVIFILSDCLTESFNSDLITGGEGGLRDGAPKDTMLTWRCQTDVYTRFSRNLSSVACLLLLSEVPPSSTRHLFSMKHRSWQRRTRVRCSTQPNVVRNCSVLRTPCWVARDA